MPAPRRYPDKLTTTCLILAAILLALLSFMTTQSGTTALNGVSLLIAAHIPYGLALWWLWRKDEGGASLPLALLFGGALVLRAVLIPGVPFFSDDVYRFVWDGRVQAAGFGAWELPPDAQALQFLRDGNWHRINNPELRTIYPPVAQLLFRIAEGIASSVYTMKLIGVLADLVVVILIFLLAGGQFSRNNNREAVRAAALYGWSPLVCMETALSGHLLEPAAIACMLGAILAARTNGHVRRLQDLSAGVLLAIGAGIKLAPLFMALSLGRRSRLFLLSLAAVSVLVLLPMFAAGTAGVETLDGFARRWEANSGLFRVFKWAAVQSVGLLYGSADPQAMIHLQFLDGIASWLQPTFFALHKDGAYDPLYPGAFPLMDIGLAVARGCCALVFSGVWLYCTVKRLEPVRAGLLIFGALVVVTPVLHPWYLLWVLPFAAILKKWRWFLFGAVLSLAYLSLDLWWSRKVWHESLPVLSVEYVVLLFVLLEGRISFRKRNGVPEVDGKAR